MKKGEMERGEMKKGQMERGVKKKGEMERGKMKKGEMERGVMEKGEMERGLRRGANQHLPRIDTWPQEKMDSNKLSPLLLLTPLWVYQNE